MLKWGTPLFWGVIIPLIVIGLFAGVPYLFAPPAPDETGRWFPASACSAQITAALLTLLILLLTFWNLAK